MVAKILVGKYSIFGFRFSQQFTGRDTEELFEALRHSPGGVASASLNVYVAGF